MDLRLYIDFWKTQILGENMDLRLYMDLFGDTDLRRGQGSEAVHRFVRRHRFEERTWI
jgi:hypothetical protein